MSDDFGLAQAYAHARALRTRLARVKNATWGVLVAVCGWSVYQLMHTPFPWVEAQALGHLGEAAVLYGLLVRAAPYRRLMRWSFVTGLLTQACLGLAQFFMQNSFSARLLGMVSHPVWAGGSAVVETLNGRWLRAYGALPHPNVFGGYMAIGALLVVACIFETRAEHTFGDALKNGGLYVLLVALLTGLMVSFSRSAFLAFVCGLGVMTVIRLKQCSADTTDSSSEPAALRAGVIFGGKASWRRIGMVWLCFASVLGMTVALAPDISLTRVEAQTRLEQQSITDRIVSYHVAFEVARKRWGVGTGVGGYTAELYAMNPSRPGWEYQPVHNAFMLAFFEMGLVMALAALWFFLPWFFSLWRTRTRYTAGLLCVLSILALFDHYVWSLWSGVLLCAVVMGVIKIYSEKVSQQVP